MKFTVDKKEDLSYSVNDFWKIVSEIDWQNKCDIQSYYKHVRESLIKHYDYHGCMVLDAIHGTYYDNLNEAIRRYNNSKGYTSKDKEAVPEGGWSDSCWDNVAHVVGGGKEIYYDFLNNPEKVLKQYKEREYTENFGYCFSFYDYNPYRVDEEDMEIVEEIDDV